MKRFTPFVVAAVVVALIAAVNADTERSNSPDRSTTLIAQAKKKAEASPKTTKKKKVFRRRVPNYYGQVGLSKKQRETIYSIQEKYFYEITALEEKIEELEETRDGEVYSVLDDRQKMRLNDLREAAAKLRKSRSSKKSK